MLHTLLDVRAPDVAIITETNVPDRENRSYFGNSDEAHLIYNFTLPPLAIDGVLNGRADRLCNWMANTTPPPRGTTLFNFIASHDGIGVRPAEGFLSDREIAGLAQLTEERGGTYGTYARDGADFPYELNISLPDLFGGPGDPLMADRVILLHSIVLAMAGVPAIYVNSLMATTNNTEEMREDGIRRTINRGRVHLDDVPDQFGESWQSRIYSGLLERATLRRSHSAFHPNSSQMLRDLGGVLAIERTAPRDLSKLEQNGSAHVAVVCNMTDVVKTVPVLRPGTCLLSEQETIDSLEIPPYGSVWHAYH